MNTIEEHKQTTPTHTPSHLTLLFPPGPEMLHPLPPKPTTTLASPATPARPEPLLIPQLKPRSFPLNTNNLLQCPHFHSRQPKPPHTPTPVPHTPNPTSVLRNLPTPKVPHTPNTSPPSLPSESVHTLGAPNCRPLRSAPSLPNPSYL